MTSSPFFFDASKIMVLCVWRVCCGQCRCVVLTGDSSVRTFIFEDFERTTRERSRELRAGIDREIRRGQASTTLAANLLSQETTMRFLLQRSYGKDAIGKALYYFLALEIFEVSPVSISCRTRDSRLWRRS